MKLKKKEISIIIIIAISLFFIVFFLAKKPSENISKQTALCIAKNSKIYVQLGCHACENQKKIFGENYKYLNVIDCFYEKEKCLSAEITATPTWIINGKRYIGVQSIEKLKEITGCK